jgi:predicted Zn-dependent protease
MIGVRHGGDRSIVGSGWEDDAMRTCVPAVLAVAAGVWLAASGCSTNEATGKKIFTGGMTREQEVQIGAQAGPEFTAQFGGPVQNPALQQYVSNIGKKMAAETEGDNPSLPWEFTLLNTDVINAFALPGGKVFFTRGLAKELTTEAQMAGVLGHEIGHVTARHGAQRIASQTWFSTGLQFGAAIIGASGSQTAAQIGQIGIPAIEAGGGLVLLKYGRDEESEADSLGMRYMSNVGYTPRGQLEVMQVLERVSGGGGGSPEFFATHPFPETRIQRIEEELRTKYAAMANNSNYGEFGERYRSQFLTPLSKLPPPPEPPKQQGKKSGSADRALALGDPATWCGVCAAAEDASARRMLASAAIARERMSR